MSWFVIIGVVLLVTVYLTWLPARIVTPRRRTSNLDPGDLGFRFQEGHIKAVDGRRLAAYYVPATVPARGNIVILHGKDSARHLYLEYLPQLLPYGYNVLLFDARAHGQSEGTYTTFGYLEWDDTVRVVHHLRYLAPDLPTGVFGHSMGGAVALQAMARCEDIDFGIIESAFTHLGDITHDYARRQTGLPLPRWLTDHQLDLAEKFAHFKHREVEPVKAARRVTGPTLVIHGEADDRIHVDHGRQLYAALASEQKELYVVPGGGHDDVADRGGEVYWRRLRSFLRSATTVEP